MRPAVLRAYLLGVVTGSMVTAGLSMLAAPVARAEVSPAEINVYAGPICDTLDQYNSLAGVSGVMQFLMGDQYYSGEDAADILVSGVVEQCPEHLGLLRHFADTYGPADVGTVA